MRISRWIAAPILLLGTVTAPVLAFAQTDGPLKVEDLLSSREFGQLTVPVLSPDQQWLVYAVKNNHAELDASSNKRKESTIFSLWKDVDLYIVNTNTGDSRCLTGNSGGNGAPSWSPDGRNLAFLSDRDGDGIPKLWIWQRATGKLIKVSDVYVRSSELLWLNNQDVVMTLPPEDSEPGRDPRRVPHTALQATSPKKSESPRSSVTIYRSKAASFGEVPQAADPPWNLDALRKDLAIVDVVSGNIRRLTHGGLRIAKYAPSPDGTRIAFSSPLRFEQAGSQQVLWNLSVVSLATGALKTLAADIRLEYDGSPFSWSPDGRKLAYLAGGPQEHDTGVGDCFIVDLSDSRSQNVSTFADRLGHDRQRTPLWDNAGRSLYFIRSGALWIVKDAKTPDKFTSIQDHEILELVASSHGREWSQNGISTLVLAYNTSTKQSGFYRVDLETGVSTKLQEESRCYHCSNVNDHVFVAPQGDKLAYFAEDAGHGSDLWISDADFHSARRLTHLNPQLEKYEMGESRLVQWRNIDGRVLQGALLLPPHYDKEKRYPLVVWVYSGSTGSKYVNQFGLGAPGPFNMQLLATRGYAILYPDIPEDAVSPMFNVSKCVLPGVNRLIEMGIVDPDRIGVMGHSFGGYSTLALITQTARFKAAIELDGAANLLSAYGEMGKDGTAFGVSWLEGGQAMMGGTPWQLRDKYIENSPYFYLDRVASPLLIVHGDQDWVAAPFLADELFVALRRLGKKVEYAKYGGEGHSAVNWAYPNQIDFCHRMLAWFDRYLGGSENGPQPRVN